MKKIFNYDILCVVIILYDGEKKVLLQLRTDDAPILPNYWAFFGGGIKPHETPIQAVIRETKEELNYDLKEPKVFKEKEFMINGKKGYMYVFIEELTQNKDSLELREGKDWGWFNREEVEQLKMIEFDKELLKEIFIFLEGDKR